MAYENATLEELMEMVRQKQTPSVADTDVFFDEDFWEPDEPMEEEKVIDLAACIARTLENLAPYRLSAEDQQTVREFLTLHIQTKQSSENRPEARRAYYNLLIRCDEKESVRHFADVLRNALEVSPEHTLISAENALIQQQQDAASRSNRRRLIPMDTQFILIEECQEAPRLNLDGAGSTRDASKKAMDAYNTVWDTLFSYVRSNPGTILIVGGDESVYRSTLRPFSELSQRVCSHHIQLIPQTEEDLLEDCMTELRNSSFALAEDLAPALKKYFQNAYHSSELRGQAFVSDLLDRIYTRYYSSRQETGVLSGACVPEYDPLTQSAESILGQLDELVGLETVKTEFRNIYRMQVAGLADSENMRYHMSFVGNPGTGKTTVARMAADLFFRMGIIKTNKLVVVKPCDLVSEWIGGTGMKAMEMIRRAYNGVLFIDEAYGIANMDRGEELLNVLLQEMENHADKLIVIFAGYTDEMRELLKTNPGLASRIGQELHFEDYTQEELARIFLQMCKKDGFSLDPSARDELDDCISALMTREFFSNARDIRNMLQDLKEVWSDEFYDVIVKQGRASASVEKVFRPHHFEKIMPPKKEVNINDLIGLEVLKKKLATFKQQALYQKHLKEKGFTNLSDFSMHMVFTGNPGTGKTTVAKLIADDLYSIGMLKTNRLVIAERKDLVSVYGDTGKKTADVIRKAMGGVLFVDEAYSLAGNRHGSSECIEVMLTAMEEHKADTVFIFAGYVEQMQDFLLSNPGIQSRIGYTFHFDNYSAQELTRMYGEKMKKTGFVVSEDAMQRVREIMEYFLDVKNFGNGRFVNHVIHQTISQRASRDFTTQYRDIQAQDIPSIKTLIETAPNSMHLYDPTTITQEERRRVALHELGHAVVMVRTDSSNVPQSISIRNQTGSMGRVVLKGGTINQTEQQLLNYMAMLLGGKNAEKLLTGSHSTGCVDDVVRAKRIAEEMIQSYAMVSYGETPAQILKAADQLSLGVISKNKDRLERLADRLLEQKELTGEEFMEALQE